MPRGEKFTFRRVFREPSSRTIPTTTKPCALKECSGHGACETRGVFPAFSPRVPGSAQLGLLLHSIGCKSEHVPSEEIVMSSQTKRIRTGLPTLSCQNSTAVPRNQVSSEGT